MNRKQENKSGKKKTIVNEKVNKSERRKFA